MTDQEMDSDLIFDLGRHCGITAMQGILDAIDQRLRAIGRPELRGETMLVSMAYCDATLARFRMTMTPREVEMLDGLIAALANDSDEINVVRHEVNSN